MNANTKKIMDDLNSMTNWLGTFQFPTKPLELQRLNWIVKMKAMGKEMESVSDSQRKGIKISE